MNKADRDRLRELLTKAKACREMVPPNRLAERSFMMSARWEMTPERVLALLDAADRADELESKLRTMEKRCAPKSNRR